MMNTRNLLALLTVTTAGLAACEPLFVDFDGYREYPPDSGAGAGNGGSGNGGSTSGGDGGSAAGGSGNSGGDGGSAAGGSGNSGGNAGTGNAGSGNAAGNGGSAGSGGDGCAPEDPVTVCGTGMSCQFTNALVPPDFDYTTRCEASGTGVGVNGCKSSDSTMCAPGHFCYNGAVCYRWCRLGTNDCAVCGGGAICQDIVNPIPTRGSIQYGLCSDADC